MQTLLEVSLRHDKYNDREVCDKLGIKDSSDINMNLLSSDKLLSLPDLHVSLLVHDLKNKLTYDAIFNTSDKYFSIEVFLKDELFEGDITLKDIISIPETVSGEYSSMSDTAFKALINSKERFKYDGMFSGISMTFNKSIPVNKACLTSISLLTNGKVYL